MDPTLPFSRLEFMASEAGLIALVTTKSVMRELLCDASILSKLPCVVVLDHNVESACCFPENSQNV